MKERRRDAAKRLREAGRWNGGRVPYGYKPEAIAGGFILVPDPDYSRHVEMMAERIVAGTSANRLTKELNDSGVPTSWDAERIRKGLESKGAKWSVHQVLLLLRSPHLRGYVQHWPEPGKPVIVRGHDGLPVRRVPILTDERWTELQAALDGRSQNRTQVRSDAAMLLQVAYCRKCGQALWGNKMRANLYYRCRDAKTEGACDAKNVRQDLLEEFVSQSVLFYGRSVERTVKRTVGEDHSAEIATAEQSIEDIERLITSGEMPAASGARMLTRLEENLERLRSLPKPHEVEEPAGETLDVYWARIGQAERRQFLLASGSRVEADENGAMFSPGWRAHPSRAQKLTREWKWDDRSIVGDLIASGAVRHAASMIEGLPSHHP
jgi:site-specific DNA recombinase